MRIEQTNSSCAVMEIEGISFITDEEIEALLSKFSCPSEEPGSYTSYWNSAPLKITKGVYFFADRIRHPRRRNSQYPGNAQKFVAEIKKRNIGKLLETDEFKNTTGNICRAWLWQLTQADIIKAKQKYGKPKKTTTKRKSTTLEVA